MELAPVAVLEHIEQHRADFPAWCAFGSDGAQAIAAQAIRKTRSGCGQRQPRALFAAPAIARKSTTELRAASCAGEPTRNRNCCS